MARKVEEKGRGTHLTSVREMRRPRTHSILRTMSHIFRPPIRPTGHIFLTNLVQRAMFFAPNSNNGPYLEYVRSNNEPLYLPTTSNYGPQNRASVAVSKTLPYQSFAKTGSLVGLLAEISNNGPHFLARRIRSASHIFHFSSNNRPQNLEQRATDFLLSLDQRDIFSRATNHIYLRNPLNPQWNPVCNYLRSVLIKITKQGTCCFSLLVNNHG